MPRITSLPDMTTIAGDDELPIVDVDEVITKKVTPQAIKDYVLADGNVVPQMWTNPYKFYAYRGTSNQTITTATWTKIQLNTEKFDSNSNFDNSTTYLYTIPVDGFYLFTANMYASGADGGYSILQITKNPTGANSSGNGGTVLCEQRIVYTGNANKPNNAAVFDQFTAGDTIGTCAYIEDATTPTILLGAGQTFLSGFLVSET